MNAATDIKSAEPAVLDRLLRKPDVISRVALSYPTIWRKVRAGTFPAPVQISDGRIAWKESAIVSWMNGLTASAIQPKARSNGRPRKRRRS